MISRVDQSFMAEWWRTIDRALLGAILLLMICGAFLSFSTGPAGAEKHGFDPWHFTTRHFLFLIPSFVLLFGCAFANPTQARRASFLLLLLSLGMMLAIQFIGAEIKGARRWISIGSYSIQPSEWVKPAFAVTVAWLLAEGIRKPDIPGSFLSILLLGIVLTLLISQPDFGQTALVGCAWAGMFFMAGASWKWIGAFSGLAGIGFGTAYLYYPHVAKRFDDFLSGFLADESGEIYQLDTARMAILNGGWFGRGPGEGEIKSLIPESHADFPFAVAVEEFGIVAGLLLIGLIAFIALRVFRRALDERDPFIKLASCGLALFFSMQSIINLMVTLQLLPAKGMTLPFISYGGSSLLGSSIGMGFALALTRKRPDSRSAAPMESSPRVR